MNENQNVTQILQQVEQGDATAVKRLLPLVYEELRRLAAQRMSAERPDHTLQPTALVHEAWLRLVDVPEAQQWDSRGHFFVAAAEAMRRILIDQARRRLSEKRGGQMTRRPLTDEMTGQESDEHLVMLDEALTRLRQKDPIKAELVTLRYFSGLTLSETAAFLQISEATADRYWSYARAWLHQEVTRILAESEETPAAPTNH